LEQLQGALGVGASGNLVFSSSCAVSDATCIVRPNICDGTLTGGLACLKDVFVSWDGPSAGLNDLYGAAGWSLNPAPATLPNLPQCGVVLGAQPLGFTFPWTEDFFGVARDATTSMGAAVLNGCCL
jgi:hypothetical protein